MSVMRSMFAGIVLLLTLALIPVSATVQAAGMKIGVVNGVKVVWTSAAGQELQAQLKAKQKEFSEKIKAENAIVVGLREEIEKKSTAWSDQKKDEKIKEFNDKSQALKANDNFAREQLVKMERKGLAQISKELKAITQEYGAKHGFNVILDAQIVHYYQDAMDISDDLIKALDSAHKK